MVVTLPRATVGCYFNELCYESSLYEPSLGRVEDASERMGGESRFDGMRKNPFAHTFSGGC